METKILSTLPPQAAVGGPNLSLTRASVRTKIEPRPAAFTVWDTCG
jgi:hypothetical protein